MISMYIWWLHYSYATVLFWSNQDSVISFSWENCFDTASEANFSIIWMLFLLGKETEKSEKKIWLETSELESQLLEFPCLCRCSIVFYQLSNSFDTFCCKESVWSSIKQALEHYRLLLCPIKTTHKSRAKSKCLVTLSNLALDSVMWLDLHTFVDPLDVQKRANSSFLRGFGRNN
jgi:hypothetical protein